MQLTEMGQHKSLFHPVSDIFLSFYFYIYQYNIVVTFNASLMQNL